MMLKKSGNTLGDCMKRKIIIGINIVAVALLCFLVLVPGIGDVHGLVSLRRTAARQYQGMRVQVDAYAANRYFVENLGVVGQDALLDHLTGIKDLAVANGLAVEGFSILYGDVMDVSIEAYGGWAAKLAFVQQLYAMPVHIYDVDMDDGKIFLRLNLIVV